MNHRTVCVWVGHLLALFACMLFPVRASARNQSILYSFNSLAYGQYPEGGLISDAAGNLFGVTYQGGGYGSGTVFELSSNASGGWTETVLYSFKSTYGGGRDGFSPTGSLTFDTSGNLYGTTSGGGSKAAGIVFRLSKSNGQWNETVLWNFQQRGSGDGLFPNGGLVFDRAGNLYGATPVGGGYTQGGCNYDDGCGMIFRLEPMPTGQWKETVLYVFQGLTDGAYPSGLAIDPAGNLFGTTADSYPSQGGVFELSVSSTGVWTETTIHTFTGVPDGAGPESVPIFDDAGNLYGTTTSGGASDCGTVFELTPGSNGQWGENILYNFSGADGQSPSGALFRDDSGNLYGTTSEGGAHGFGSVFELSQGSGGAWNQAVLWNFTASSDGESPLFGVVGGKTGHLYGPTGDIFRYNGSTPNGNIFSLVQNAGGQWQEITLTSFPDTDGADPLANLVADAAGNLYGTNSHGGAFGFGTAFELTNSGHGWKETVLYDFPFGFEGSNIGSNPSALIFDGAGNLYGEVEYGNAKHYGTVFELSPAADGSWTERDIFTFTGGSVGRNPAGGLIFDTAGNLYGTTTGGGNSAACGTQGCGTVFELSPLNGAWTQTILYNFTANPDGANPAAGLAFDQAGNLYGTTQNGGNFVGTVFNLSPSSGGQWTETVLYQFTNMHGDGAFPLAAVVFDQTGNLYGTTSMGGNHGDVCNSFGCGIVFELSPSSGQWKESVLYSFTGTDSTYPTAPLVFDQAGNLYGTAQGGSYFKGGEVFKFSPQGSGGWSESVVHRFSDAGFDGSYPAGVIVGPGGYLYGATLGGGKKLNGEVFAVLP